MNDKLFVLAFGLLLIIAQLVSAQDSSDQTVARLQTEIARREAIDRDEGTPAELKVTNRVNLEKARTELLSAVQAKISALQKYLDTLGDSITPQEKDDARDSLRRLSSATNSAGNGSYLSPRSDTNRSVYYRESAAPSTSTVPPSVLSLNSNGNTTNGLTTEAIPSMPTSIAPFEIISPLDKYPTELKEIEVFVHVTSPAATSIPLRWRVKNAGKEFVSGIFTINAGGIGEKVIVPLRRGENEITISDSSNPRVSRIVTVTRGTDSRLNNSIGDTSSRTEQQRDAGAAADPPAAAPNNSKTAFTRAIFGLEQAAAASADPEQKLFLEFNLTAPIFGKDGSALRAPLWLWLNPRITSLPKPISGSVADFATASGFTSPFTSGKVNEIVQGFEFLGGLEVPITAISGAIDSGFGPRTKARFGLSLVAGAGMSAPFSSQKTLQVFKVNQTVIDRFPGAAGKDFIAFVAGDRNRFFRQYYGGLRLKTYFVKANSDEELDNIFPGIIDVTFGQNESVTGGDLHGGVVRIDGIYPFPFAGGGSIYVFGSALMKLSRPKIGAPIILQPPDATVQVPGENVFIQQLPPRDTDHYRLGVGVDLIRLLKKNK